MLKIFLRKRFVCGVVEHWFIDEGTTSWETHVWRRSFDDFRVARFFCVRTKFEVVVYDRKTGVTVDSVDSVERINSYFKALEEVECTKK